MSIPTLPGILGITSQDDEGEPARAEKHQGVNGRALPLPRKDGTPGNKARDAAGKQMVLTPTTDADKPSLPSSPSRHPGTHPMVLCPSPHYPRSKWGLPVWPLCHGSVPPPRPHALLLP